MHILLIEDDPFIARAVSAALESEAHVVTYAPTGPEGLAALRVHDVDAVLLDLEDPLKIVSRTKDYLMEPEFDYETKGFYNGCVFPTGNVVRDGVLYVYYGCADKFIALATANFDELVDYLYRECRV